MDKLEEMSVSNKNIILPRGLKLSVTPPHTYTMRYANGARTYSEPFVKMHASKEWAQQATSAYDQIFIAISGACSAIPYVGPAMAFAVQIGSHWFKEASKNSDGSIDFYAAHHYIGTNAAGLDVTAWPLPGVDANAWQFAVNGLMQGVRLASPRKTGGTFNAAHQFRLQPIEQSHADDMAFDFNFSEEIEAGDDTLQMPREAIFTEATTKGGNPRN